VDGRVGVLDTDEVSRDRRGVERSEARATVDRLTVCVDVLTHHVEGDDLRHSADAATPEPPPQEGDGEARQTELLEGPSPGQVQVVADPDEAAEQVLGHDLDGVEGRVLDLVGGRAVGTVLNRDDQVALLDSEGATRLGVKRSDHLVCLRCVRWDCDRFVG